MDELGEDKAERSDRGNIDGDELVEEGTMQGKTRTGAAGVLASFPSDSAEWDRALCLAVLRESYAALGSLPKKSDFSEQAVARIKAFFGPWPRALEAAGVKEPRSGDRKEHNREKRIRAKRNRRQEQKEQEQKEK